MHPNGTTALGLQVRHSAEREISRRCRAGRGPVSRSRQRGPAFWKCDAHPRPVGSDWEDRAPRLGPREPRQGTERLFPFPDDAELQIQGGQQSLREDREPGPARDDGRLGLRSQGGQRPPGSRRDRRPRRDRSDYPRSGSTRRSAPGGEPPHGPRDVPLDILREAQVEQRARRARRSGRRRRRTRLRAAPRGTAPIRDSPRREGSARRATPHHRAAQDARCRAGLEPAIRIRGEVVCPWPGRHSPGSRSIPRRTARPAGRIDPPIDAAQVADDAAASQDSGQRFLADVPDRSPRRYTAAHSPAN